MNKRFKSVSYFPGCSLATTAKENNASLKTFLSHFGVQAQEIQDWNCCGSSSTHSIDSDLALSLGARNLFLAPCEKSVLIACPGCYLRLNAAKIELKRSEAKRKRYEDFFGKPYPEDIHLMHFFELLVQMDSTGAFANLEGRLNGLKIAPYYGCMLARPPSMTKETFFSEIKEKTMTSLGGAPVQWPFFSTCCGTFLSVSRPGIAEKLVNRIMAGALKSGADCIVTACAMCHLNLELRCRKENRIPVFHFSELLSLSLEDNRSEDWFKRHLIDPRPLLRKKALAGQ